MDAATVIIEILKALNAAGPLLAELLGTDQPTLEERLTRARDAAKDPIDTSADDAVRRAKLGRILRGEE